VKNELCEETLGFKNRRMDRPPTRYPNPSANSSLNNTTSIKALSSMKYPSVCADKTDLKPANLNRFENIRESE